MVKFGYSKVDGESILTVNNKLIFLPAKVSVPYFDYFNDVLITLLRQPENKADENVYGINKDGDIVWELNKGNYLNLKHGFIQAYKDEGGNLWVINLGGRHFNVDHETGKILDTKYEEIDYEINGKMLHVNGKDVEFSSDIFGVFPIDNVLVVITLMDSKSEHVFGLDNKGNIIWVFDKDPHDKVYKCCYRDKKWWIQGIDGYEYAVDPKTGEVLERVWLK